ncbi:hypothetical protein DEEACLCL_00040 [Salmonella phage CRW-SP2]|nr:hypothetical protein DEEACLCL_00040 [Salmonella phage CRW-SP2]
MADYLSQYTGQQIDQILTAVDTKVSKNDVINDFAVNDPLFPPSARLTYLLNQQITSINQTLANNVIRTDGGEQTISGRKKFSAQIDANGGINVPTQMSITIVDEPINNTDAVNLSMLKKHGVSEDTATAGSGLKISLLPNGYNQLSMDAANLTNFSGSGAPNNFVVHDGTGTFKWPVTTLATLIFSDSRFSNYVLVVDYDQDMLNLEGQINTINTTLAGKVNTSTYNTKMTSLDNSISSLNTGLAGKVDTSTYNTKMTSLDTSISSINTALGNKVETSVYTTKMNSLDTAIAGRVTLAKTNLSGITVSAGGTNVLPDFDMANIVSLLITAKWGSLVDSYRVYITYDGTLKTELLVQKSTAGTVTFAGSVVSGKLRLTITNANSSTACSVDYNILSAF